MNVERIHNIKYPDTPSLLLRLKKSETVVAVDRESGSRQQPEKDEEQESHPHGEEKPEAQAEPGAAAPAGTIDVVV